LLKAKLLGILVFVVATVVMTQLLSFLNLEIDARFPVGFMIGTFAGILTNCWLRPVAEDNKNK
jgi:hypothetical protein